MISSQGELLDLLSVSILNRRRIETLEGEKSSQLSSSRHSRWDWVVVGAQVCGGRYEMFANRDLFGTGESLCGRDVYQACGCASIGVGA